MVKMINYDEQTDILRLQSPDSEASSWVQLTEGIQIEFDSRGNISGIKIRRAKRKHKCNINNINNIKGM